MAESALSLPVALASDGTRMRPRGQGAGRAEVPSVMRGSRRGSLTLACAAGSVRRYRRGEAPSRVSALSSTHARPPPRTNEPHRIAASTPSPYCTTPSMNSATTSSFASAEYVEPRRNDGLVRSDRRDTRGEPGIQELPQDAERARPKTTIPRSRAARCDRFALCGEQRACTASSLSDITPISESFPPTGHAPTPARDRGTRCLW
jgi:hypothetical protein